MAGAHNIEVVRKVFEAYRAGAPERALQLMHSDVEYDARLRPDGKVWRGHAGVREALAEWTAEWEGFELEVERYLAAGAERVLVLWRERGRARASGVSLVQSGFSEFELEDGLIVAIVIGLDQDAALRALGLER